ncbi:MAG: TetR/AcrR family transcriptional regulator [Brevinematia bacterium]
MKDSSPKEKIISSAIRLFCTKGFDATSMDEVAKEANVNKAMIYYYFLSKEGLLNSIIRKSVNDFSDLVSNTDLSECKSIEEFITKIVSLAIEYIDSNTSVIKIFFREGLIYSNKIGTTINEIISLVFENVISRFKNKFVLIDNISFVDQVIMTNLVIGIIDLKDRLPNNINTDEYNMIKNQYIQKVSEIICNLVYSQNQNKFGV